MSETDLQSRLPEVKAEAAKLGFCIQLSVIIIIQRRSLQTVEKKRKESDS